MRLQQLKLTNFKNYEQQSVDCSAGLVCFVGNNGMGKTNLLDAIHYLCMGKSHFYLPDQQVARHGTDFFRLEGHFEINGKNERIVAKVQPKKKKVLERNAVPYHRLSEHIGLLPVVMITPNDTYLASEGSEARRGFMDNTLSQLDSHYLSQLILYNKLLQQRNALLKQMAQGRNNDHDLLEAYGQQMLAPAQLIHQKRAAFIEQFQPPLAEVYQTLCGGQEKATCVYRSKLSEHSLGELLIANTEKDRFLQRTTAGPHRDDLIFELDGHAVKRFASQGQLKSFVLALKLAQYQLLQGQKKRSPLLLLDDIFDKLDSDRVSHLLGLLLNGDYGQVFITDTDQKRLYEIAQQYETDCLYYRVDHGIIHAIDYGSQATEQ